MAMSDRRVLKAMGRGDILISPFRRDFLSTSSYDVCLGEYFYREQVPQLPGHLFNIYDPAQVAKVWGEVEVAPSLADAARADVTVHSKLVNITQDDRVIVLEPGETILAHTNEFIGGRVDITTMMKARSSFGRSFISVCKCAGWGDVGYINRWTMEITNNSRHYRIPLIVGERIAQIIFMETGPIAGNDYAAAGNYQSSANIEELKANWHPSSMLPRTKRTAAPSL